MPFLPARSRRKGIARLEDGQEDGDNFPAINRSNGSYHCDRFKNKNKCDVCQHMVETNSVFSSHFQRRHAIAGHNVHLKATEKVKLRWFVYLQECLHPNGTYQYVGSTNCVTERWSNTKSKCRAGKTDGSGMEKHFKMGYSANNSQELENVRMTLLEHYDCHSMGRAPWRPCRRRRGSRPDLPRSLPR